MRFTTMIGALVALASPAAAEPARATRPRLDPACVIGGPASSTDCGDDGFPVIARDGKTIATTSLTADRRDGSALLTIEWYDVKTARQVRARPIRTAAEVTPGAPPPAGARAQVAGRIAAVQRVLAAGAYRSLIKVPIDGGRTGELSADRGEDDTVRLHEGASILWQRRFAAELAFPPPAGPPREHDCTPTRTQAIALAWDPPTRTVYAAVTYVAAPDECDDPVVVYVAHVR